MILRIKNNMGSVEDIVREISLSTRFANRAIRAVELVASKDQKEACRHLYRALQFVEWIGDHVSQSPFSGDTSVQTALIETQGVIDTLRRFGTEKGWDNICSRMHDKKRKWRTNDEEVVESLNTRIRRVRFDV